MVPIVPFPLNFELVRQRRQELHSAADHHRVFVYLARRYGRPAKRRDSNEVGQ